MNDTPVTHAQLVEYAARYLRKKNFCVVTEIATTGEEPDALGWHGTHSTLIECKASRSDFLADRAKQFRRQPEHGIGDSRYYLVPHGLLAVEELPAGWGLLELRGQRVALVKKSDGFETVNRRHEAGILLSVIRRLGHTQIAGTSIRFYQINSKNRASLSVDIDDCVDGEKQETQA